MGFYVDGFVVPVPKRKLAAYTKMARLGKAVWLSHGALAYHECIADDAPYGKRTSFPRSVKLKPDEVVWFSWIVYRSRKHRDRITSRVLADKRFANMDMKNMPFDPKRMIFGGFRSVVSS